MLLSILLVLAMMPALAFFEAGMLRSKNTLSIVMQIMTGMVIQSVMWFAFGYSLTFGPSVGGVIGDPSKHVFLRGISYFNCSPHATTIVEGTYGGCAC